MFQRILFSIVFVFIFHCMQAQTTTFIGLSAGTAFSTFKTSSQSVSYDYKVGYKISVPVIFHLNRTLSLNTGLSFFNLGAQQQMSWGVKYAMDPNDPLYQGFFATENTFKDHLNYLSIPMALSIHTPFQTVISYAKIGGYVSYLVSANEIVVDNTGSNKTKIDLSDGSLNRFDAGILFGVGFLKRAGKGSICVEGEYMIGKSNIHKSDSMMFPSAMEVMNRSFFFNVGYIIKLNGNTCY